MQLHVEHLAHVSGHSLSAVGLRPSKGGGSHSGKVTSAPPPSATGESLTVNLWSRRSAGITGASHQLPMTNTLPVPDVDSEPSGLSWFQRPLSGWWCAFGWLLATAILVAWIQKAGGPAGGDAFEVDFSSWAIAHGQFVCMYPPLGHINFNYGAPVYPLLSGGVEAVARIGHGTPFPTSAALGHNCSRGLPSMAGWALKSDAIIPDAQGRVPRLDPAARRRGGRAPRHRARSLWMGADRRRHRGLLAAGVDEH